MLNRTFLVFLLSFPLLVACAGQTSATPPALPIRVLQEPASIVLPVQPLSRDDSRITHEAQVQRGLELNGQPRDLFLSADEIAAMPTTLSIEPFTPPPDTSSFSGKITVDVIPYQESGLDPRLNARTFLLEAGATLRGVLLVSSSIHMRHEAFHDVGLTVLLNHRQIDVTLGNRTAPSHIIRLPKDRGVFYDFALPQPLPEGTHTLTIILHYDPTQLYTSYAFTAVALHQGRRSLAGYWLPVSTLNAWTIFVKVGTGGSVIPPLQTPDQLPLPKDYAFGELKIARTANPNANDFKRDSIMLAADEPGRLYAFVTYRPPAGSAEPQQTQAVITAFVDDHQMPIDGHSGYVFEVEPGKLYRIPLNVEFPHDGYLHILGAIVTFTPFLPEAYSTALQPDWLGSATHPRSTRIVALVPGREWIPFLPEIP